MNENRLNVMMEAILIFQELLENTSKPTVYVSLYGEFMSCEKYVPSGFLRNLESTRKREIEECVMAARVLDLEEICKEESST